MYTHTHTHARTHAHLGSCAHGPVHCSQCAPVVPAQVGHVCCCDQQQAALPHALNRRVQQLCWRAVWIQVHHIIGLGPPQQSGREGEGVFLSQSLSYKHIRSLGHTQPTARTCRTSHARTARTRGPRCTHWPQRTACVHPRCFCLCSHHTPMSHTQRAGACTRTDADHGGRADQ